MEEKRTQREIRTCPVCGCVYSEPPALSRLDNQTYICPDCGTREALTGLGIEPDEQARILETIHKYTKGE